MYSSTCERVFNPLSPLKTTIMLLAFMILYSTYWIDCVVSQCHMFVRKEGYFKTNALFHNFTTATRTSCLIECEKMSFCQGLNVIEIRRKARDAFNCQLYNSSTVVANGTLEETQNSTFYSRMRRDCQALKTDPFSSSGVYTLNSYVECSVVQVYCDMTTNGGGWILLQKRFDGSTDFYRDWNEYKFGFGSLEGEFWLGLQKFYQLTNGKKFTLRFDMWKGENHAYMEYYDATISAEADRYRLDWQGGASGTTGDSMGTVSKNKTFTTKDIQDNDCARKFKGAWWFGSCFQAHLNGVYGDNRRDFGILWKSFSGASKSLSKTEIKFKCNY